MIDQLVDAPSPLALLNNDSFPDDNVLKNETNTWSKLYFDTSKYRTSSNVIVKITPPMVEPIPLSYHLKFLSTNNTVEYKALLVGLHVALITGA